MVSVSLVLGLGCYPIPTGGNAWLRGYEAMMKREKRSSPYEGQANPMRDLNIAGESPDDDIIELDDIIEMPSGFIDEDEDLDVDVFKLDPDLELEPENLGQKAERPLINEQAQKQSSDAQDRLEAFGDEAEEDEKLFEPVPSRRSGKKSKDRAESQGFEDKESFLDEFMDKTANVDESFKPAASKAAAPASVPIAPAPDLSQVAEELIGRLESRLQQHIQAIVESRLPDLVRSIINEEVQKLKKEL